MVHPQFGIARDILGELATPIIDNNDQTVFFLHYCIFVFLLNEYCTISIDLSPM